MNTAYADDYRVKDNVKRATAIVAIVLGFLALYYCLLPALAIGTGVETYVYFDNGLSQYDTIEYSFDNGLTWVVMNKYDDVKNNNSGVTVGVTRTNTEYLYVSNTMVAEGSTVIFRGTDSGTVYDTVTNYELGEAADEWGYDYKDFQWTSVEQVVYQATNCYFAPPKLMQYDYGGYAGIESNQSDLGTLRQFIYAYAEKTIEKGYNEQEYLEYYFENDIGHATLTDVSVTNAAADDKTPLYENGALLLDGTYGLKLPMNINSLTYDNGFKVSYTVNYDALTNDTATIYLYQNNNNWINFGFADGVNNDTYYLTIRYRNENANNGDITNLGEYKDLELQVGVDYNVTFYIDKGYVYCSINDNWYGFGTFPAVFGKMNVYVGGTYYGSEVGGNKDWPLQGTIDNLVFSSVSETTENSIEILAEQQDNYIYNIAKPGYDGNAIIFPHNGDNRTFYNAQYTMEGKLALVNNPNDLGETSQSTGNTTYEGSYLANADGTNDFNTLFPSSSVNGVKTYKATAQIYDYYSDWELAGKKLQDHTTTYEYSVENTIDSDNKLQSLSGGSFSEGSSRISYAYQGFLWNNAISNYYSTEQGVTPLYFGSNNSFTGNNRYYKSNKSNPVFFSDEEIVNRDYANSLEAFIKTGMNAIGNRTDGIAYLIPSVREYINNEKLTGFNTTDANIPHGQSNSRAVPGLVNMVNGNIQLANSSKDLIYFNEDYLLGDNTYNAVFGKIYNDVEFEFVYNEDTGCYEYDSTREKYATRVAQKSDGTYYMEYTQNGVRKAYNDNSSQTNFQFYPFNSPAGDTFAEENLMFGMKLTVPFTMYIDEDKRNDSIFKFSGDDDVWVYVDDKLVMDIGGTHTAVGGIVDLKNGYALLGSSYKNNVGEAVETPDGPYLVDIVQSGVDASVSAVEKATFAIVSSNSLGIGIETDSKYLGQWIEIDGADFFDDKYRGIDGGKISYKYEIREDTLTGKEYLKVSVKNAVKVETDTDGNITKTTAIKNCEGKQLVTSVTDTSTQVDTIYAIFELTSFELDEGTDGGDLEEHELSIYYMERGLNSSNFKLAFNFVENTERTVEKEFADGNENYTNVIDFVDVELYRTEPYAAIIDYVFPAEYALVKSVAHTTDGSIRETQTFVRSTDTVGVQYTVNNSSDAGIPVNTVSSIVLSMNGIPLNKQVLKQLEKDAGLRIYMNDVPVAVDNIIFYDEGSVENPQHIIIPCNGNSTVVKVEFTPVPRSYGGNPTSDSDVWNLLAANGWIIDANAYIHNDIRTYITGTGYFTDTMFSADYTLNDGETKSFVIEASDNATLFMTEVYNWDTGQYFSTLSGANPEGNYAWWWYDGANTSNIDVNKHGEDSPNVIPGHTYYVSVTRNGDEFTVRYYDRTINKLLLTITGTWSYDDALATNMNIRFKSQGGTYMLTESDVKLITNENSDIWVGETTCDYNINSGEIKSYYIETSLLDDNVLILTELYDTNNNFFSTTNNDSINEGYWLYGDWYTNGTRLDVYDFGNDGEAEACGYYETDASISEGLTDEQKEEVKAKWFTPGDVIKVNIKQDGNILAVQYLNASKNSVIAMWAAEIPDLPSQLRLHFKAMDGTLAISEQLDNVIVGAFDNYSGDVSQSYEVLADSERYFIIEVDEDAVAPRLMTELSNEGVWFTTFSNGDGWFAGETLTNIVENNSPGNDMLTPGHSYRVTVNRSGNSITITYYDLNTRTEVLTQTGSADNIPETMYVYFRSHGGTFVVEEEYYEQVNITGHKIFADSKTDTIIAPASGNQPARTFNAADMRFVVLRNYRYVSGVANTQYNYTVRAAEKTADLIFSSDINAGSTRYVLLRQRAWDGIMNNMAYVDTQPAPYGNGVKWTYEIAGSETNDDLEMVVLAAGSADTDFTDETRLANVNAISIAEPYDVVLYTSPVYVSSARLNKADNQWEKVWDNIVESATIEGEAKNYNYFIREVNVSTAIGKTMEDYKQVYYDYDGNIIQPTYMEYTTSDANGNEGIKEYAFYSIDNDAGYVKVVNIPEIEARLTKVWSQKTPIELIQTIYVDIYNSLGEYVTTATINPNNLNEVSIVVSDLPAYAYTNGAWEEVTYYVKEKDISGLLPTYSTVWQRENITLSNGQTITVYPLKHKNEEYFVEITNRPVNTDEFVMWIYKMSETNKDIPVEGAIFQLEKYDEGTDSWNVVDDINDIVSDDEGYVYLGLLDYGSYRLTEVYAPLGYAKSDIAVYFDVIIPSGDDSYENDSSSKKALKLNNVYTEGTSSVPDDYYIWLDDSYILRIDIENEVVPVILPHTGGSGTYRYVLIGLLTILIAFAGMQLRKKRSKKPEKINYNNKQLRKREDNFSGWRNIMKTSFKKKLIAMLAIVCMLTMTLVSTVMANTITITSSDSVSVAGKTIKAYKIFTAEKIAGNPVTYAYTLNPEWKGFFTAKGYADDATLNSKVAEYIMEQDDSASETQALAEELYTWAKANNGSLTAEVPVIDGTGSSATATFSGLDSGYYLITDESNDAPISAVMLGTYISGNTEEDLTIQLKADVPSIEKKINDGGLVDYNTATIGEDVNYQLSSTVPDTTGYTTYVYRVVDTLSQGLTLDASSIAVTIGGDPMTKDTDYTVNVAGNVLTIELTTIKNLLEVAKTIELNEEILITYNAEVNENAEVGSTGNPNSVQLEYSNNPLEDTTATTGTDVVITYLTELNLEKKNKAGDYLSGAEFTVVDGHSNSYTVVPGDTGKFTISGLTEETYTITETVAPSGYNKLENPILLKVEFVGPGSVTGGSETGTWKYKVSTDNGNSYSDYVAANGDGTFTQIVINEAGGLFPSTGGIGTTIFMVVGGALMLGAVVLFAIKKRANTK